MFSKEKTGLIKRSTNTCKWASIFIKKSFFIIFIITITFSIFITSCSMVSSNPTSTVLSTSSESTSAKNTNSTTAQNSVSPSTAASSSETPTANGETFFVSEDGSFSFFYPESSTSFASNQWLPQMNTYFLAVESSNLSNLSQTDESLNEESAKKDMQDIAAGNFGADISVAYGPSKKVVKSGGKNIKEFIIFGRDECDYSFERQAIFYDGDNQTIVDFTGNNLELGKDLDGILVKSSSGNCKGLLSWSKDGKDKLYQMLLEGKAPLKVQQWYDSFDKLISSLKFYENSGKVPDLSSGGAMGFSQKTITEDLPEIKSSLKAAFPVLKSLTGVQAAEDNVNTINSLIENGIVGSWISGFKKTAKDSYTTIPSDSGWNFELQTDYSLEYLSSRFLSISFINYSFLGGAHGNTISETLNWDFKAGRKLSLEDIFKPGFDYLKFISDYCNKDIIRQYEEMGLNPSDMADMIKSGLDTSVKENFSRFIVTGDSIAFRFDPYQVGPYYLGTVIVRIPFSAFGSNLNI